MAVAEDNYFSVVCFIEGVEGKAAEKYVHPIRFKTSLDPLKAAHNELEDLEDLGDYELISRGRPLHDTHSFLFKCDLPGDLSADEQGQSDLWDRVSLPRFLVTVKRDQSRGSPDLTRLVFEGLAAWEPKKLDNAKEELLNLLYHMCYIRPSLASVRNIALDIYAHIQTMRHQETCFVEEIKSFVENLQTNCDISLFCIANYVRDFILTRWELQNNRNSRVQFTKKITIFSMSYSSTVLKALENCADCVERVYICESRPQFEGVSLAEKLSSIVDVTIITDAQMNLFIPHCDLCLVGADTVCTDGSIISKVGTCLAAMSAKYHNVPYLVVLHTFKWTSETKHFFRAQETDEIQRSWLAKARSLKIQNIYFERTAREFIGTIICEKGIVDENFFRIFFEQKRHLLEALIGL